MFVFFFICKQLWCCFCFVSVNSCDAESEPWYQSGETSTQSVPFKFIAVSVCQAEYELISTLVDWTKKNLSPDHEDVNRTVSEIEYIVSFIQSRAVTFQRFLLL